MGSAPSSQAAAASLEERYIDLERYLRERLEKQAQQLEAQAQQMAQQAALLNQLLRSSAGEPSGDMATASSALQSPAAVQAPELEASETQAVAVVAADPTPQVDVACLSEDELWTLLKQTHGPLIDDVARCTNAEMEKNWAELTDNHCSARNLLCCHFSSGEGVWWILSDGSLGLRASKEGQLDGGCSVCVQAPHEMGWEQYGRGAFRATVGQRLWGEKARDVLLGNAQTGAARGKDADKLSYLLIVRVKRIVRDDASRLLPGRPQVLIIHPEDLLEGPDGHHYLERTHIVKVWRLHNPDQELQNQLDLRDAAAQREEEERKLQEEVARQQLFTDHLQQFLELGLQSGATIVAPWLTPPTLTVKRHDGDLVICTAVTATGEQECVVGSCDVLVAAKQARLFLSTEVWLDLPPEMGAGPAKFYVGRFEGTRVIAMRLRPDGEGVEERILGESLEDALATIASQALQFSRVGASLAVEERGTVVTYVDPGRAIAAPRLGAKTGICEGDVMCSGRHYAEFTFEKTKKCDIQIGFGPPGMDVECYPPETCPDTWRGIDCKTGDLVHNLSNGKDGSHRSRWKRGKAWTCKTGDVLGLLLDFESRTMEVFKNGESQGLAGIKHTKGRSEVDTVLDALRQEVVWTVTMTHGGDTISVCKKSPP